MNRFPYTTLRRAAGGAGMEYRAGGVTNYPAVFLQDSPAPTLVWPFLVGGIMIGAVLVLVAALRGMFDTSSIAKRWTPPPSRSRVSEDDFKRRRR